MTKKGRRGESRGEEEGKRIFRDVTQLGFFACARIVHCQLGITPTSLGCNAEERQKHTPQDPDFRLPVRGAAVRQGEE